VQVRGRVVRCRVTKPPFLEVRTRESD